MAGALDQIAEAADETALDQQRLARRARSMSRQRRLGWSWEQILQRERQPGLLSLLTRSVRRLHEVSGRFRPALAKALGDEGLSTRQIAKMLGVTHQRISAMLNRPGPKPTPLA
jgi:transcriptional regulator of aromatic amino acid metabolism